MKLEDSPSLSCSVCKRAGFCSVQIYMVKYIQPCCIQSSALKQQCSHLALVSSTQRWHHGAPGLCSHLAAAELTFRPLWWALQPARVLQTHRSSFRASPHCWAPGGQQERAASVVASLGVSLLGHCVGFAFACLSQGSASLYWFTAVFNISSSSLGPSLAALPPQSHVSPQRAALSLSGPAAGLSRQCWAAQGEGDGPGAAGSKRTGGFNREDTRPPCLLRCDLEHLNCRNGVKADLLVTSGLC